MSEASTLELARELLFLAADTSVAAVLEAARRQQAEWKAACTRGNAQLRAGAAKKLARLEPLLPPLEIEADLTELESAPAAATGADAARHRLAQKKLADRLAALPDSDERTLWRDRLAALQPAAEPPPDPAATMLAAKLAALRDALARGDRAASPALLSEARVVLPLLQKAEAKTKAEAELTALAAEVAKLLEPPKPPADPVLPVLEAKLAALRQAVARAEGEGAPALLAELQALAPSVLDAAIKAKIVAELATIERDVAKLREPPKPPPVIVEEKRPAAPEPASDAVTIALPPPLDVGDLLRLVPKHREPGLGPIHFVARPQFIVGRFPTKGESRADYSCPPAEKRVSRSHAIFLCQGGEILLRDASDDERQTNGTWLNGKLVRTRPQRVDLSRAATLVLGVEHFFTVMVEHLPGAAPGGPPVNEPELYVGRAATEARVAGCVRFSPRPVVRVPVEVAWIFSDALLGTAPDSAITLPKSQFADVGCRVHYWRGGFWIENLRPATDVLLTNEDDDSIAASPRLDGGAATAERLMPGRAVPLRSGQVLRIAHVDFAVTIESAL